MIRRATAADMARVVEILTSAFSNYVWTEWTVPSTEYNERLAELQSIYFEHFALRHGKVLVNDELTAVAAFIPSDMPEPEPEIHERIAALHGDRLQAVVEADQVLESKRPPHDWILASVGVDPRFQRQGLGRQVCAAGLQQIADSGHTCLVETSEATNVAFYELLGFEVVEQVHVAGGPTIWLLVTRPAGGGGTSTD